MASALVEARERLNAKRTELANIFEKYPDLKLPDDVREDIKARNTELTELGKAFDAAREMDDAQQQNAKALHFLNAPANPMVHPNGGANGATAAEVQEQKSWGELFTDSVAFTGYQKAFRAGPSVEIKTVLTQTGFAPQAVRSPLILGSPLERPRVADVLPQGTTDQNAIVYMEETTTTNAAAGVTEGNAKPESALAFTERTSPVRKIATVLPITDELMADVPAMRAYVEARLRLFLALAEDAALLTGAGSPSLTGMLNTAGIQTQAKGADPTPDAIYKAMVLIQTQAFLEPSAVIANPLDWQDVRLLRTVDGIYIWGAPMDPGPERIWGLPVVTTTAETQNTMLVGAFSTAVQLFRREGVTFAVSSEHSDFFIRNQLMLRVELREALVVYRPSGLCKVTGV